MRNDALHRHQKLCGEQGEQGEHGEHGELGLEHDLIDGEARGIFINSQVDVMEQRVDAVARLPNHEP